ncbi:2'-5' RNA ligase family protein [Sphingobacterium suaedae]|uniref:2'-5' RNA ligase family protein n=2 Tax=Sphingobacterium suaedae TaxID=1686402 RepID=A0ABW5KEQ4_9SPHI
MEKMHISIVFQPCEKGIRFVASLKQLAKRLLNKWYPSCHSIAHISICKIEVSERDLAIIVRDLTERLRYERGQYVYFDRFSSYPSSGTLYIDPTVYAKKFLRAKMRTVVEEVRRVVPAKLVAEPHVTIGRQLEPADLVDLKTSGAFEAVDFDFFCGGIVLRKFNHETNQYEAFLEIPFRGEEPSMKSGQLSLGF